MSKWEYCELRVTYMGTPSKKNMAALFTYSDDDVVKQDIKHNAAMAQLGRDGWELVNTQVENEPGPLGKMTTAIYFFKRPLA